MDRTEPNAKVISLEHARHGREADGSIPLTDREDDDLMLLARGGNQRAFDVLVRRHQQKLLRSAYRQTRDTDLAQDVVQNAFVELYKMLPRYEPQGKLGALLYRIMLNQCRMHWRRKATERSHEDKVPVPQDNPESDDRILVGERMKVVDNLLHELPEKLREVVVLRYAGELSYEEIGASLDIPLGTVKSRLSVATDRLKKRVASLKLDDQSVDGGVA